MDFLKKNSNLILNLKILKASSEKKKCWNFSLPKGFAKNFPRPKCPDLPTIYQIFKLR
jgi:hypothetical protein